MTLKSTAANIQRLRTDIEMATQNAKYLESQLASTGNTRTVDDVQSELSAVNTK